jgi:transcriptional regulator with GAF, ATPase, and Fis domain
VEHVDIRRGQTRRLSLKGRRLSIELPDLRVSAAHAALGRVLGSWAIEDCKSRNGTFVNGERIEQSPLADGDLIEVGQTFLLFREEVGVDPEGIRNLEVAASEAAFATLSPLLAARFEQLKAIAPSRVPVLVKGETGTGKELVASGLHVLSGRPGVFQAVNCGALPATLVESELFGFRKGAFSGAIEDRPGLIRAADHGTLFLDEIGDLPLPAQAALLRVLQEGEVVPVGATRPVPVDFRLVAATHRDLDELVAKDRFRADLLARISGFALELPPLRERREDIGLIAARLLTRESAERAQGLAFTAEAVRVLLRYGWPLNIRELERCLQAGVVLAGSGTVETAHFAPAVQAVESQPRHPHSTPRPAELLSDEDLKRCEDIAAALKATEGNITAAAQALGKHRMQLYRWLRRYGIDPKSYRPAPQL